MYSLKQIHRKYQTFEAFCVFVGVISCILTFIYIMYRAFTHNMITVVNINSVNEGLFEVVMLTIFTVMATNYLRKNYKNYLQPKVYDQM